jgi:hypothetical protein
MYYHHGGENVQVFWLKTRIKECDSSIPRLLAEGTCAQFALREISQPKSGYESCFVPASFTDGEAMQVGFRAHRTLYFVRKRWLFLLTDASGTAAEHAHEAIHLGHGSSIGFLSWREIGGEIGPSIRISKKKGGRL